MKIINLAQAPEHIPTIAAWHHAQWGYLNPGGTLETRIEKMQRYLKGAAIPAMYICVDGKQVVGTAALVESDMDSHPELSPWLASVYVNPDYRNRGVGAALVKRIVSEAKALGHSPLYLFTPDREKFYRDLGWQFIAHEPYRGSNATLMKIEI
ncbi:MAG: GNAT family N-acetyltransferase [Cellvibrio sp.]|uniref:GNAT family N-acetyltransferase n=1 Tax=Cellvibrio sp. TaxID=1965322 RepID=UPI0031A62DB9